MCGRSNPVAHVRFYIRQGQYSGNKAIAPVYYPVPETPYDLCAHALLNICLQVTLAIAAYTGRHGPVHY